MPPMIPIFKMEDIGYTVAMKFNNQGGNWKRVYIDLFISLPERLKFYRMDPQESDELYYCSLNREKLTARKSISLSLDKFITKLRKYTLLKIPLVRVSPLKDYIVIKLDGDQHDYMELFVNPKVDPEQNGIALTENISISDEQKSDKFIERYICVKPKIIVGNFDFNSSIESFYVEESRFVSNLADCILNEESKVRNQIQYIIKSMMLQSNYTWCEPVA